MLDPVGRGSARRKSQLCTTEATESAAADLGAFSATILIRFVTRAAALVLMVAALVGLVYDGACSIANNELALTPLGGVAFRLFPSSFMKIQPVATALHPMLWDPVLLHFFLVPGCVFGFTLGALLLWAGRKPEEPLHPSCR